MKLFLLKIGAFCICLLITFGGFAQVEETEEKSILVTVETLERDFNKQVKTEPKPKKKVNPKKSAKSDFYRHHKKLPKTFEGFVIELTTSDFPLNRDYHLFDQFGAVFYDQVKGKGYSYLILADFSSKESIKQYIKNVVIHKAPEARLIEYKKGARLLR